MQLKFTKMHCLDSDFVVTEMVTTGGFMRQATVKRLAQRTTGIGFKFFILIEHPQQAHVDFNCLLFNADGQPQPLHIGAIRCAALFISENGLSGKKKLVLSTANEVVEVEFLGNELKVSLPAPLFEPERIGLDVERYKAEYDLPVQSLGHIPMGALRLQQLHAIVRLEELDTSLCQQWGKAICQQEVFSEAPYVSFIQTVDDHHLKLASFSTTMDFSIDYLAAAAVVSAQQRGWTAQRVTVMWQGHELLIEWDLQQNLHSTGVVNYVYDGRVFI